jgi:hypothetical protein
MGGTMEYPRIRARNGLNDRRMEGDPYNVGEYGKPGAAPPYEPRTIWTDYLQGEMNRMEQSYMGIYAGMDHLPKQGAAVTGLTEQQVLSVMRWFFGLREPLLRGLRQDHASDPLTVLRTHDRPRAGGND